MYTFQLERSSSRPQFRALDILAEKPLTLTRIGVIGDIHCEDEVLSQVLAHFTAQGTTHNLAVGDVVDGHGDVNRTLALLEDHRVLTISGNHDRWLLENVFRDDPEATRLQSLDRRSRALLSKLPTTREFRTPLGELLLCHGLLDNDMAKVSPDDFGYALDTNDELQTLIRDKRFAFVLNGHTHRPMVRKFGALTLINAGTLHRRYRQVCTIVDFERAEVELYDIASDGIQKTDTTPL